MKSSRLESRQLLPRVAGALVILVVGAAAVAVFARGHSSHTSVQPTPSPTGPPLFMFHQPAPIIDFYTWDGKLVRRLVTSQGFAPSDDGRLYIDPDGQIFEAQSGGRIGVVADWRGLYFPEWADDSAHICSTISQSNGSRILEVIGIHGDTRQYTLDAATQYAVVTACSITTGRAAILDSGGVRVLSLRDGTTINTIPPPDARTQIDFVSRDVRWLVRSRTGDWRAEVVDLTDGSIKASYQLVNPAAFSPDNRLLVVGLLPNTMETRVLDWRTGEVVWRRTTYEGLSTVKAVSDVATDKLLVELHTRDPNAFHYVEYWIIDGQGNARPFHPVP